MVIKLIRVEKKEKKLEGNYAISESGNVYVISKLPCGSYLMVNINTGVRYTEKLNKSALLKYIEKGGLELVYNDDIKITVEA